MTQLELISVLQKAYDKKAIYIPGVLVYYQNSKYDRKELYFDKEEHKKIWEIIHNSEIINCVDENMQSFLSLNEDKL